MKVLCSPSSVTLRVTASPQRGEAFSKGADYGIISAYMKVMIVHNRYRVRGGEDSVVENETAMLKAHGHEVIPYIRSNDSIKGGAGAALNSLFSLKSYHEIKKIIRKEKPDIVHVHNTIHVISPAVYYAALSEKVPVVQTMHNFRLLCPNGEFYRKGRCCEDCVKKGLGCALKHKCYRNSLPQTLVMTLSMLIHRLTGIYKKLNYIALTDFDKNKFEGFERIYVKPNFTSTPGSNYDPDSDYYIFIGRIEENKGIATVARAFSLNKKKLVVIGDGSCADRLRRYIKKHELDNIDYKGHIEREELNAYLKGAKALIAASTWYETFGMTVIEAYAAGVPVIANDFGNMGALVEEGVTGLKYKRTAVSLNECIEKFEQADRKTFSENALKEYEDKYTEEKNYCRLMEIYEEARS